MWRLAAVGCQAEYRHPQRPDGRFWGRAATHGVLTVARMPTQDDPPAEPDEPAREAPQRKPAKTLTEPPPHPQPQSESAASRLGATAAIGLVILPRGCPMPNSFSQLFRLQDADRTSFVLSPARDRNLYVEQDSELKSLVRLLAQEERPIGMVSGDFGSGKSHLLRAAVLHAGAAWEVHWVELSAPTGRGFFGEGGLHPKVWKTLMENAPPALFRKTATELEASLAEFGLKESNLVRAIQIAFRPLQLDGQPGKDAVQARSWLACSRTATAATARHLNLDCMFSEALSTAQLPCLYDWLADMRFRATGTRQLLVLDESNTFTAIKDAVYLRATGDVLRSLVDPDRKRLGVLWGAVLPRASRTDHPAFRQDVTSRIAARRWELRSLSEVALARKFIDGLWGKLTAEPALRPFLLDEAAIAWILEHLRELRVLYHGATRSSLAADPSRRDLLHVLDLVAQSATERDCRLITVNHLTEWLPLEGE
jgi:hypothetical protein